MTGATKCVAGRRAPSTNRGRTLPASRDTTSVVDLLAELDALAEMARQARCQLAAGHALTGSSALERIQHRAADAARWARKEAS